jgi:hypothetical protein
MGVSYLFVVFLSINLNRIKGNLRTILNQIKHIGRKVENSNKLFYLEVVCHFI